MGSNYRRSQYRTDTRRRKTHTVKVSLSLGSFLAVCLSWGVNHSIGWAIFHFFCSWWYVLYYFLFL